MATSFMLRGPRHLTVYGKNRWWLIIIVIFIIIFYHCNHYHCCCRRHHIKCLFYAIFNDENLLKEVHRIRHTSKTRNWELHSASCCLSQLYVNRYRWHRLGRSNITVAAFAQRDGKMKSGKMKDLIRPPLSEHITLRCLDCGPTGQRFWPPPTTKSIDLDIENKRPFFRDARCFCCWCWRHASTCVDQCTKKVRRSTVGRHPTGTASVASRANAAAAAATAAAADWVTRQCQSCAWEQWLNLPLSYEKIRLRTAAVTSKSLSTNASGQRSRKNRYVMGRRRRRVAVTEPPSVVHDRQRETLPQRRRRGGIARCAALPRGGCDEQQLPRGVKKIPGQWLESGRHPAVVVLTGSSCDACTGAGCRRWNRCCRVVAPVEC